MLPEIKAFQKWLRRKSPHASTQIHYTNDLKLFFTWIEKAPPEITLWDIDAFIDHSQQLGYATATINRRLACLRSPTKPPRNPSFPSTISSARASG
jgi:site-specific recombinase XerD